MTIQQLADLPNGGTDRTCCRGHGDRFYSSDIAPLRPGLEIWYTLEDPHPQNGVSLWDARSGALIFGTPEAVIDNQVAGGLAGDIDPAHPGMELWGDRFYAISGDNKVNTNQTDGAND